MKLNLIPPLEKDDQEVLVFRQADSSEKRQRSFGQSMGLLFALCLLFTGFVWVLFTVGSSSKVIGKFKNCSASARGVTRDVVDGASGSIGDKFNEFTARFNKSYSTEHKRALRFEIFKDNLRELEEERSKHPNAVLGIHAWMDQTEAEMSERLMSNDVMDNTDGIKVVGGLHQTRLGRPESFSLKGYCGPVRAEGKCGAAWSFATVASVETLVNLKYGWKTPLSAQEVLDCSNGGVAPSGCSGGYPLKALGYIRERGVVAEAKYPYVGWQQKCMRRYNDTGVRINNVMIIRDEETLADWIYLNGPATIIFSVTQPFYAYHSGVFSPSPLDCATKSLGSQVMTVVGYGVERGQNYWLLRNSWGAAWGDGGYIKVARGVNSCGLTQHILAPTL